mmetsp:Transcript_11568/g.20547  ORF Transcript_11568/g.20547 Transcript_11568/m.20547 type:complete len:710 (-) Transcript_11568:38-2167(-)
MDLAVQTIEWWGEDEVAWRFLLEDDGFNTTVSNYTARLPVCTTPGSECGNREESEYWYVGVIVSIVASVLSNFGVNTQKYSMIQEIRTGQQRGYTRQPIWMLGLFMVILGAVADFGALGFAAQSLITPVGGMTMVANLFFASYWLGEVITRRDLGSTSLIVLGIILVAAFADKSSQCFTLGNLMCLYKRKEFIAYAVVITSVILLMYVGIVLVRRRVKSMKAEGRTELRQYNRYRKLFPLMCASLSGIIGAQSVLFAKSTIEILKSTIRGNNEFAKYQTYFILVAMLVAIFGQIHWLAVGLKEFDAVIMVPVFQCVFVVFTIMGGAAYFDEFRTFTHIQTIMFPLGVLLLVIGVLGLATHKSRTAEELLDEVDNQQGLLIDVEACDAVDSMNDNGDDLPSVAESVDSRRSTKRSFFHSPFTPISPRSGIQHVPTNESELSQRRESVHRYDEFNRMTPLGAFSGRILPFMLYHPDVGHLFPDDAESMRHENEGQGHHPVTARNSADPKRRSSVPTRRLSHRRLLRFGSPIGSFFGHRDAEGHHQQHAHEIQETRSNEQVTSPSEGPQETQETQPSGHGAPSRIPLRRAKSASFAGIEHLLSSHRGLFKPFDRSSKVAKANKANFKDLSKLDVASSGSSSIGTKEDLHQNSDELTILDADEGQNSDSQSQDNDEASNDDEDEDEDENGNSDSSDHDGLRNEDLEDPMFRKL